MQKKFLISLLFFLAIITELIAYTANNSNNAYIKKILSKLESISMLKPLHTITFKKMSKDEIKSYINNQFHKQFPSSEMNFYQELYSTMGLIPPRLKLEQYLIALYGEQVGGFYDPWKKIFVASSNLDSNIEATVIAHELTHAIQDQYVSLAKLQKKFNSNDDASLAVTAVIEGSATAIMIAYAVDVPIKNIVYFSHFDKLISMSSSFVPDSMPLFKTAPTFLRNYLLFPYASGTEFIKYFLKNHTFLETMNLLKDPPTSTEQILHPEKYFSNKRDLPKRVNFKPKEIPPGFTVKKKFVGGEFLLREFLKAICLSGYSSRVTLQWGGDLIALVENENNSLMVVWKIVWDNPDACQKFCMFLRNMKIRHSISIDIKKLNIRTTLLKIKRREEK